MTGPAPPGARIVETVRVLQSRHCTVYALDPQVDASDFVVDDAARDALRVRLGALVDLSREALLVHESAPSGDDEPELCLALLLEDSLAEASVEDDARLDPWCALLEGVSHLLYVIDRARTGRSVSRLELELQAEVDKYVGVWVSRREAGHRLDADRLWRRLFEGHRFEAPDAEAVDRYRAASHFAGRYCRYLGARYLSPRGPRGLCGLWPEIRRFWRMDQTEKLGHIEALPA